MFEQAFKNIDDVLWKEAGCTTKVDYTEQTSWLFLIIDHIDELRFRSQTEKLGKGAGTGNTTVACIERQQN